MKILNIIGKKIKIVPQLIIQFISFYNNYHKTNIYIYEEFVFKQVFNFEYNYINL